MKSSEISKVDLEAYDIWLVVLDEQLTSIQNIVYDPGKDDFGVSVHEVNNQLHVFGFSSSTDREVESVHLVFGTITGSTRGQMTESEKSSIPAIIFVTLGSIVLRRRTARTKMHLSKLNS